MSIFSRTQLATISSAASGGMIPRRACTRASAASMSRYFRVRFSSDHTARMASVRKMLPKMAESMIVEGMVEAFSIGERHGSDRLLRAELGDPFRCIAEPCEDAVGMLAE